MHALTSSFVTLTVWCVAGSLALAAVTLLSRGPAAAQFEGNGDERDDDYRGDDGQEIGVEARNG